MDEGRETNYVRHSFYPSYSKLKLIFTQSFDFHFIIDSIGQIRTMSIN